MEKFICKKCGNTTYIVQEKSNGTGVATGLYCAKCGAWHKWLNKQEKVLYSVREKTDKDKEIARLTAENARLKKETAKEIGDILLNQIIQSIDTPDDIIIIDKQCLKDIVKRKYGVELEERL